MSYTVTPKGSSGHLTPQYSQAPVAAFSKVAFEAMAHIVSAWIPSLAGRARCVCVGLEPRLPHMPSIQGNS